MKTILFNERGDVHWVILYAAAIIIVAGILCISYDSFYISNMDKQITRKVNDLNLDIYTMLDVEYTAFDTGFDIKDDLDAYLTFQQGLQLRFDLDGGMMPPEGSPFQGKVSVVQFHVVHDGQTYNDGYGNVMEHPGIVAELLLPIKTPLLGITGNHRVLITTEVFR